MIHRAFLTMSIISVCTHLNLHAQDIIIKQNGDEIQAKVTRVSSNEIEYKKWTYQDGPLYTLNKSEIFMIKYINGEKEVFNTGEDKQQQITNVSSPQYVKKSPANNNQQLIDRYKTPPQFAQTQSDKDAKWFFPIMSMSDSSIVSTSDIEMLIVPTTVCDLNYSWPFKVDIRYRVELHNKTDKVMYIDLANTFRVYTDGTSESYYKTEQTTVTQGNSSGAGFNLGGITNAFGIGGIIGTLANSTTVGGSSQSSMSTTYVNQRILAIPPHSKKNLTEYKQVKIKKNQYETISELEIYYFYKDDLRGHLKKNGYISYSEENSPYTVKYIITYSTTPNFSEYSSLYAKLYTRYVYGNNYYSGESIKDAIEHIQEYITNFWDNPGIIVGGHLFGGGIFIRKKK